MLAEALEGRCLLSVSPSASLMVFNSIATGSSGAGPSPIQTLTLSNTGATAINLGSSALTIINDSSVSTQDASEFSITNSGSVPATLAAGASTPLTVRFTAPSSGLKSAILQISTNDATTPLVSVTLHGLGTTGTGGGNEPSLAAILRAYNIPTIVGDGVNDVNAYSSTFYPNPPDASSQEVALQRLQRADTNLPASIQLLGTFAVSNQPSLRFGYYPAGDPQDKTSLFTVSQADAQTVHPTANGITSFSPTSPFALYTNFPTFTDNGQQRVAYSEDSLNTWDSSVPRKIRFFPLENPNGTVVPNAYVFTAEDYNLQYDSNDIVGIIRNVKAAPGGATGPVLGLTNTAGIPFTNQLFFNRIQHTNTQFGDTVHDTNTIQINNTGGSPLTINSITLSDSTNWQVVNPPSFPAQVAAGGSLSVTVKFIATTVPAHTQNETNTTATTNGISVLNAGGVYNATLTIASNDLNYGTRTVGLSGYWQYETEHENEPGVQTIANMAGYTVNTGATPTQPDLVQGATRVVYGDEVVSGLWASADPTLPVTVQLLASFHNQGNTSTTYWYNSGSGTQNTLFTAGSDYGQALLPNITGTTPAKASFSPAGNFGLNLDGEKSEDNLNTTDINTLHRSGHAVRFYPLRDQSGKLIPNAWMILQDYENGQFSNDDFQDLVEVAFNMRPAAQAPAPATVSGVGINSAVSLQWTPVTYSGAVTYNVYRSSTISGTYTQINSSAISGTSFVDSDAPANTQSFYKVTAVSGGVESQGTNASATPLAAGSVITGPGTPVGFAAIGSTTGIALTWSSQSDAVGFNLLRSTSASGPFLQLNDAPLTGTSFSDTSAPTGVASFYQLIAVDASQNPSTPATASATRPGTVNTTSHPFGGKTIYKYTDGSHVVTLRMTGPGTGTATFIGDATTPSSITLDGTTAKTIFTITSTHGAANIGDLVVNGSLNRLVAAQANSIGSIVITGTLGALQLASAGNGHTLIIQTGGRAASLVFGNVTDLSINSAAPISLLQAKSWAVTNGNLDVIHAPTLAKLVVAGQFGASLDLTGTGRDLTSASVRGGLTGGTWTIAGSLGTIATSTIASGWSGIITGAVAQLATTSAFNGKLTASSVPVFRVGGAMSGATVQLSSTAATTVKTFTVNGAITSSQVRSAGGIGSIRAAALVDSNIFAGVNAGITTLPTTANDFASVARIGTAVITGLRNQFALNNGNIAAANIGTVTVGTLNSNNGGVQFGIAADTLQGYTRRVNGKLVVWTRKKGIAALTPDGDAVARVFSQA